MAKMLPVPVTALPRVQDRMSFLYLEHSVVHRQDGALTARNDQGTHPCPCGVFGCGLSRARDVRQPPGDEPSRRMRNDGSLGR